MTDKIDVTRNLSDMIFSIMSGNKEAASQAFANLAPHYQALALNKLDASIDDGGSSNE